MGEGISSLVAWANRNRAQAIMLLVIIVAVAGFYLVFSPLSGGTKSFARWAWEGWNSENDLEHGFLILPGAMLVAWMSRDQFAAALRRPSGLGLVPVILGLLLFLVATWTLQPRLAIVALPLLIWGSVWYLWGWPMARIAAFPCGLLFFMVPIGFILSRTVPLQLFVARVVSGLANLFGVGVERRGMDLLALDGSFQCQVAGGCSGIRSIMAMTMLSLLYVHFYERVFWKKVAIFAVTIFLAIPGNVARVFSIVLASKWFGQKFGTGPWHDFSGFIITLPIAVGGMLLFAELLNADWSAWKKRLLESDPPRPAKATDSATGDKPAGSQNQSPISYDY